MRVGNYSLVIPEGTEREAGYVALPHGTQYTIQLRNHSGYRRCDAAVTIDGKPIGTFRLGTFGGATLEKSPDEDGRFTFYASGSGDAAAAGEAAVSAEAKGLIQVRFVPETKVEAVSRGYGASARSISKSMSFYGDEKTVGGITGLSGHSDQRFTEVGPMPLDEAEAVLISIRLILGTSGPRPLIGAAKGNPVPPPV